MSCSAFRLSSEWLMLGRSAADKKKKIKDKKQREEREDHV